MLEVLLDALLDTLRVLPLLFIVYILLELLEYKGVMKFENSKFLKGGASPVFGSLFGCVPQCGFSVISTDLYSERKISIGALIAVFIATSDEAIPIMLGSINAIPQMLMLIAVKIVMGIAIGYLSMWLYSKVFKNAGAEKVEVLNASNVSNSKAEKNQDEVDRAQARHLEKSENLADKPSSVSESIEEDSKHSHSHTINGCCHHSIEQEKFDLLHPVLHCLKISVFILIVNVILGTIIYFVTEDRLVAFLEKSSVFQPILAVAIGLIPNCVSSLVLTELFLAGGLSFGSIVAGLSVNAGLGIIVLFKQNKNIKENIFILLMLIIPSLLVGYGIHLLF